VTGIGKHGVGVKVLTIRDAQFEAFRRARLERREVTLFTLLRDRDPASVRAVDDATLRRRIHWAVQTCVALGIDDDEPIGVAVLLIFELHPGWPRHPAVQPILADRARSQRARMQAVVDWYVSGSWVSSLDAFGDDWS
jgi:hypothetical protein